MQSHTTAHRTVLAILSAIAIGIIAYLGWGYASATTAQDVTPTSTSDWKAFLPAVAVAASTTASPVKEPTVTATPTPTPTTAATPTVTPTPTTTMTATNTPTPMTTPCASLSGIISTNTTLVEDCDYVMTGNTLVSSGVTLSIPAGVRLLFDGVYYLKVDGTLAVQGTQSRRVVFTSRRSNPAPGDWVGVHLMGSSGSTMSFATIEYAGATVGITGGALHLTNGPHAVDNSVLRQNQRYVLVLGDGDNTVRDSLLTENQVYAEMVSVEGSVGTTRIISNTVTDNSAVAAIVFTKNGGTQPRQILQGNFFGGNSAASNGLVYVESANADVIGNAFLNNVSRGGGSSTSAIVQVASTTISTTIACNLFSSNRTVEAGLPSVVLIGGNNSGRVTVNRNSLIANLGNYDIGVRAGDANPPPLDATNNYWGTNDASEIAERIYDYRDDFYLPEVVFTPYLDSPPECVPTAPE